MQAFYDVFKKAPWAVQFELFVHLRNFLRRRNLQKLASKVKEYMSDYVR